MAKLFAIFICLIATFSLVQSLRYDVQLKLGRPEEFKPRIGTLKILVVQGFNFTEHALKTT